MVINDGNDNQNNKVVINNLFSLAFNWLIGIFNELPLNTN